MLGFSAQIGVSSQVNTSWKIATDSTCTRTLHVSEAERFRTPRRFGEVQDPEGTEPEGTASEGYAPEGTVPEGTAPEGTVSEGTTHESTVPEGTTPEGTAHIMSHAFHWPTH